jgi:hypothetical protein
LVSFSLIGWARREGTMVVVVGVIDEEFMVELVTEKKSRSDA